MTQESAARDRIREFIQKLATIKGVTSFKDEELLFERDIVDSLSLFRVVAFLEDTFGIRILDEEINYDNFKSVDAIVQLVVSKQQKSEPKRMSS